MYLKKNIKKENLFGKILDNGAILNLILLFITYLKRARGRGRSFALEISGEKRGR